MNAPARLSRWRSRADLKERAFLSLELQSKSLPKKSWVKISQIRTLSIERVGQRLGKVSLEELAQVIEGLNEIISA
jgi:mRNA interferase MazF